uniref:Uncharacterized protein n=1 Tax=Arundo donax TaxID=35708 RepID=A0A0A8Y4A5_ARUDO
MDKIACILVGIDKCQLNKKYVT